MSAIAALTAFPAWALLALLIGTPVQAPAQIAAHAEADFAEGHFAESVAEYDRLIALIPSIRPELWQRGIALYYLGRYDDCAAQFALFHALNPADMENTAWHFFCVARAESPDRARASLLAADPDPRIVRQQVYDLLRGKLTPAEFIADADASVPIARFYAHLYLGLYLDATGDAAGSLTQMKIAAADEYRAFGGFMNIVAQVHVKLRTRQRVAASVPAGPAPPDQRTVDRSR